MIFLTYDAKATHSDVQNREEQIDFRVAATNTSFAMKERSS